MSFAPELDVSVAFRMSVRSLEATKTPRFALLHAGPALVAGLGVRDSGTVFVTVGSLATALLTTATPPQLDLDAIYAVALRVRFAADTRLVEGYLAKDGAPFGQPCAVGTAPADPAPLTKVRVGATSNQVLDALFDDITVRRGPPEAP